MSNCTINGGYIGGDSFGARLGIDFSKAEITKFLEKLGYKVYLHAGPSKQRVDGMYDDHAMFAELHVKQLIAVKEGQYIPERLDDPVMHEIYAAQVFLDEFKRKLLDL